MNLAMKRDKEYHELRKKGIPLMNTEIDIIRRYGQVNMMLVKIKERNLNIRVEKALKDMGYEYIGYQHIGTQNKSMQSVIKDMTRGKIVTDMKEHVYAHVFEKQI